MNKTLVTIPGQPIPLKRHRTSRGRTYDPQAELKETIFWIIRNQIKPDILQEDIKAKLSFFMRIPKYLSNKKKLELLNQPHCKKPDLDNLIKFYLDVCNGLLYKDDAQINTINAKKIYSDNPRTIIEITSGEHQWPKQKN